MRLTTFALLAMTFLGGLAPRAWALDDEHWKQANASIERGIAYLRTTQGVDGSWSPQPGPAITALALRVLLDRPDISRHDPAVAKALDYVLSRVKPDGGIYDQILPNYNTAICLSALALVHDDPRVPTAIAGGQAFLRQLQWADQTDEQGRKIDASHPFYGGAGYGSHGRPDMSNTQIMLQGLYDSGLDCNDPAFQRALVFISRCQGTPANKEFADKIVPDGGFIYATSISKELMNVPQSMASPEMVDEAKAGRPVSGLRTYGSMTYAGFKSYLYANLDRNDPRVLDAIRWIRNNYTLDRNPGLPEAIQLHGYYYYLMTFARAMDAWGSSTLTTADGQTRDWANDLITAVTARQRPDGSWTNEADRWMEGDANLVTTYAMIALLHAMH
jgi:squalene-hopene/tetraprenyl-beta-curcumene cyclase